jgi:UDP-N-acetylmuramyl tripeptide synthase
MSLLDAKVAAARLAGAVSRRAGRGGTSLPGKLLLRLEPRAVGRLADRLPEGTAVVSATNGKTTTTAMAAAILRRAGHRLVHNRTGANMAGGVAGALLEASRRGRIDGDLGLFEVDEFWLDRLADELRPRALLLGNLFRDQLDRFGELDAIADRWATLVARLPDAALALNADDPMIADLGRDRDGEVIYFGIEDAAVALPELQHAADAKHCRRCGGPYTHERVFLGHLGHYHCPRCGARRPQPQVAAEAIQLKGLNGSRYRLRTPEGAVDIELPLPGLYNIYNSLGAASLALALGVGLDDIAVALQEAGPAFGRAEAVPIGGRELLMLLVKNPAGANEVLRTLALEDGEHDALVVLNDRIADGRDVSWIWDADWELAAGRLRRVTCSGTRAAEMALRLKYAGVPTDRIAVVPEPARGLDAALAEGEGRLVAIPTYTAMLELRGLLADRGAVGGSFG